MSDLIERLRDKPVGDYGLQLEAAAEIERLRAAHKENARLLGLVIHDLQGRVEGGKLAALTQCRDRAEEAYQQNQAGTTLEIEELRAALKAGTDAAQTLLALPADECNVPFDPVNAAEIKGRRKAARHILDILNQQITSGEKK